MKFLKISFTIITLLLAAAFFQSCDSNSTGFDFNEAPPPYDISQAVHDSTFANGLEIYVVKEGDGPAQVVSNDQLQVRYTGRIQEGGKIFDSTYLKNSPTLNTTTLNNLTPTPPPPNQATTSNSVLIKGFRLGLVGMKEGEKRTIVIPPSLGYSNAQAGTNGFDLRDKTLIFDVELVAIF